MEENSNIHSAVELKIRQNKKNRKIILAIFISTMLLLLALPFILPDASRKEVREIAGFFWGYKFGMRYSISRMCFNFIFFAFPVVMSIWWFKELKTLKDSEGISSMERYIKRKAINKEIGSAILLVVVVFLILQTYISVVVNMAKPIIYLYPTEETAISVELGHPEKLTHTYPKYENSWNVLAKPNGDLVDLKTGRNLYALYWEGIYTTKPDLTEGFVIAGKDTVAFLEEKLAILGLTEREANEFIIYWLPELENNKYNFIRFQTIEEINNYMPLTVTPTPDSVIRVVMEFKALNRKTDVSEQVLTTPSRDGFVVVEWGGTEL